MSQSAVDFVTETDQDPEFNEFRLYEFKIELSHTFGNGVAFKNIVARSPLEAWVNVGLVTNSYDAPVHQITLISVDHNS